MDGVMARVALGLVVEGLEDRAEVVTAGIQDSSRLKYFPFWAVRDLCVARVTEASLWVPRIEDPESRLAGWQMVASAAAEDRLVELVNFAIDAALPLVRSLSEGISDGAPAGRPTILHEIRGALAAFAACAAMVGLNERAMTLVEELEERILRDPADKQTMYALSALARSLLKIGERERAARVNARIGDRLLESSLDRAEDVDDYLTLRAQQWSRIAAELEPLVAQVRNGEIDQVGSRIWEECRPILVLPDVYLEDPRLVALAAVGAAGNWAMVMGPLTAVSDSDRRNGLLVQLGTTAARAGDHRGAAMIADHVEAWCQRVELGTARAEALIAAGLAADAIPVLAEAEDLAITQPASVTRDRQLAELQPLFIAVNQIDRADSLTDEIKLEHLRESGIVRVAAALALAGHRERADAVIGRSVETRKVPALRDRTAEQVARTGDYRLADAMVRQVDADGSGVGAGLLAVIEVAAAAGDLDYGQAALEWFGADRDRLLVRKPALGVSAWSALAAAAYEFGDARADRWTERAATFVNTAYLGSENGLAVIADAVPPEQARRLLVRSLDLRPWDPTLTVMAKLDPEALIRFADAVVERTPPVAESPDHGSGTLGRREGGMGNG
ncbi:hypothetical protein [Kribbella sp. DT2]|uniref:hypothetical protein n=1 Tax=Kribbella sp. DT2 TaxID=3393427 RepID=UPI003CF5D545